jgi:hypothetical protein
MDKLTEKRYRLIDQALHDSDKNEITIAGEKLPIKLAANNYSRFLTWNSMTFIQQDDRRPTKYGHLAKTSRVTRIMRSGGKRWGLMLDGNIELE